MSNNNENVQEQQQQQETTDTAIGQGAATLTPATTTGQQEQAALNKVKGNIQTQNENNTYRENLQTLRRLVSQGSPINERQQDGKLVTTGYNYYAVDGKPLEEWVQATFGGQVTFDPKTKEIKENKNTNQQQQSQPQPATS